MRLQTRSKRRRDDGKYHSKKKTNNDQKKGDDHNKNEGTKARSSMKCFNCGEYGHAAFKCPERQSKKQVAVLFKKHNNKFKKTSKYSLVGRIGSSLDQNQLVDVRICDGFYVPGILDSRSTGTSLIPLRIVQEAMQTILR